MTKEADTQLLDHGWRHFEFHAQQRLSLFNFYVVLCGLIVAAWATVMTSDDRLPGVAFFLSSLLTLFSFIFWKMDQRNADLTKRSEALMGAAEKRLFTAGECLFCQDEIDEPLRSELPLILRKWSHGRSLRVMFFFVGALGIAGALYSGLGDLTQKESHATSVTKKSAPAKP